MTRCCCLTRAPTDLSALSVLCLLADEGDKVGESVVSVLRVLGGAVLLGLVTLLIVAGGR